MRFFLLFEICEASVFFEQPVQNSAPIMTCSQIFQDNKYIHLNLFVEIYQSSVYNKSERKRVFAIKKTIGVIDSGVGGLTVVKEIYRIMPDADIIYFGDSKNCPYGNRSHEEIFGLACNMINFLRSKGAECIAIACNTISTMTDQFRKIFDLPMISIIECAARRVTKQGLDSVGLIATEFTVNAGEYQRLITAGVPDCTVTAGSSRNLAALIDSGNFDDDDINAEIHRCFDDIALNGKINDLIIGCTHYSIAEENIRNCYPELSLINPAVDQAEATADCLKNADIGNGSFFLYTSGSPERFIPVIKKLGIKSPDVIETVTL